MYSDLEVEVTEIQTCPRNLEDTHQPPTHLAGDDNTPLAFCRNTIEITFSYIKTS